jgi:hypothetical protein
MRPKFTPLFFVSIAFVLTALYCAGRMLFAKSSGNLSGLFFLVCIFSAIASLLLSGWLHKVFKTNPWRQTVAELLIITAVGFFLYKQMGKVVLHVPAKFQGYIFLVYSVTNKAPLEKTSFLKAHIEVSVPSSGIIFTSSKRSGTLAIADSITGEIKVLGNDIILPFAWDTLKCGNKSYFMDVVFFGPIPANWNYKSDSTYRNLRKEQICKLLSEQ